MAGWPVNVRLAEVLRSDNHCPNADVVGGRKGSHGVDFGAPCGDAAPGGRCPASTAPWTFGPDNRMADRDSGFVIAKRTMQSISGWRYYFAVEAYCTEVVTIGAPWPSRVAAR